VIARQLVVEKTMRRKRSLWAPMARIAIAIAVACALMSVCWGQDEPPAQPPATTPGVPQDSSQQPASPSPAIGTENPPAPVSENPPITSLDLPGLEPHPAPLSYLQLGAHVLESADSNAANLLGGSGVHSITTALGSVDLERLWSNYDLALDYVGGVGYYNVQGIGFKQVQQLDVDQRITWKRGQLALRDSFSYLPEGNFAGAYGTFNQEGQPGGGAISSGNVFIGGLVLGSLGDVSRIVNVASGDLVENLTPKSSVTASAGYALLHYTSNNFVGVPGGTPNEGIGFLGVTQISGQAGYDRILGPHDQAAIVYGYQNFDFAVNGLAFHTDLIELMWGHRISGRMDFLIGAGPQFVDINQSGVQDTRLNVSGRASLRYKFPKTTATLAYDRFVTSGSGFFAGARSDIGRAGLARPIGRQWTAFADVGYAHNSAEQPVGFGSLVLGVNATTYQYGFAGFGLHRQLGHDFRVYGSYQFDYLSFDNSFCGPGIAACSRISQRHIGTLGLDWTPRPTRLD
jgi:hypothetical protein